MRLFRQRTQGAGDLRDVAHSAHRVAAAGRTGRKAAVGIQLNVRSQVVGIVDRGAGLLACFQSPFIHCRGNLPHIVDASILLGRSTGLHEVGNGDGGQQANDGHDNHDFHQGETRFAGLFYLFHTLFIMYLFIIAVTCHDATKVIALRALGKLEKKRASGAPSTPAF
jgi:hypothetical protein